MPLSPRIFSLVATLLMGGAVGAQIQPVIPDQERREAQERLRTAPPPKPVDPKLIAPANEPAAEASPGPSFILQQVEFSPSQLLSRAELDGVVAPQLGKATNFGDVKRLAQEINALYLARGHLTARAFVPSQRVADGTLRFQLIESKLGRLEPATQSRLSPGFVQALLATPEGSLIDIPAINERLVRLHRNTSDNRIGLAFSPSEGKNSGLSDIQVQVEEPAFWTARLSFSNEGSDSLGKQQVSANLALNNLLGWTDKLSLLALHSKGASSGNLQYSLPLPGPFLPWGTRLTAGLSNGTTQTIAPGFESVSLDGSAVSATLSLAQPLWSAGPWSLDGLLSLVSIRSRTDIAAERFSDIRTQSNSLGLTLTRNTEGTSASLGATYNQASTRALGLAGRSTGVIQLNANAQQVIGGGFWALARAVVQRSNAAQLSSTLQFQVGGAGNVRGYPSPSAAGDEGETLSIELHRAVTPISERLDAYVFADEGRVSTERIATSRLASAGVGLNYQAQSWSISAAVASPLRAQGSTEKGSHRTLVRLSFDLDKFLL